MGQRNKTTSYFSMILATLVLEQFSGIYGFIYLNNNSKSSKGWHC